MQIYIPKCIHTYINTQLHITCLHTYSARIYVCTYIHNITYTYNIMYLDMYIRMYIQTCIYICTFIGTHNKLYYVGMLCAWKLSI